MNKEFSAYLEEQIKFRFEEASASSKESDKWWKKNAARAIEWVNDNYEFAIELGAHEDDTGKDKALWLMQILGIKKFENLINENRPLAGLSKKNEAIVREINAYLKKNKALFKLPKNADFYKLELSIADLEEGKQTASIEAYNQREDVFEDATKQMINFVNEIIRKQFAKYKLIYKQEEGWGFFIFPDQSGATSL